MKYIFTFFTIIFLFTACQNKQGSIPELKTYNSFDKFNYSKESITFFEREFDRISTIENPKILEQYLDFYKQNSNYFLNGKVKVKALENQLTQIREKQTLDSQLAQLKKAETLEKKESIKIYKQLAKEGNIKAQRELVERYKINNPSLALKWLEKLVRQEDIHSMKEYASANIYMVRPIIVQDLNKAIDTYEKLAKLGELSSLMRLGNIYEYGYHKQVAPRDRDKSLTYYELAASKNYEIAQKKLYEIYSCKECKPNRYNPEKAQALQKILNNPGTKTLERLEKKIKIPKIKKEIIKEKVIEEIKEIKKRTKLAKKVIIKCYDMKTASIEISDKCKNKIKTFLNNDNIISKIVLIPVLDKSDFSFYDKDPSKEDFLEELGRDRALEIKNYLNEVIKELPRIKTYEYYVTSKKSNKGVIIKFY